MPEHKSPENFEDMLKVLNESFLEDAEALFSLPEDELDKFLAKEGIDPAAAIAKVQGFAASLRSRASEKASEFETIPPKKLFFSHRKRFWTHPDVLALGTDDPINYICKRATEMVLEAFQAGWHGPPFDPAKLAEYRGLKVIPKADVADARIVSSKDQEFQIEFNPAKNKARIRFSLAHELAHTLFPNCAEAIRHRQSKEEQKGDDWQLEMLCNLAAAEFLMPIGHFPQLKGAELSICRMLDLRRQYEVSTEALLLRFARLTEIPCAVFAASERGNDRYSLEYAVASRSWPVSIQSGISLPKDTHLRECSAIGYTSIGEEEWLHEMGRIEVQCVRVSPFPDESVPRFIGFIRPNSFAPIRSGKIIVVKGNAMEPRGEGHQIVAHVVNDKTPNWGAGFGRAIQHKWPEVQQAFRAWVSKMPNALSLGKVFYSDILEGKITVFHMICQHGYGPSPTPRLRYAHLKTCLEQLAQFATDHQASIHMPKIGSGQGGGSWQLIEQMIDEVLCSRGLNVTVYELPNQPQNRHVPSLFD